MNSKFFPLFLTSILIQANSERQPRIWAGKEAQRGQFPYQVLLIVDPIYCGAAVLNENYVITAAHCVKGKPIKNIFLYFDVLQFSDANSNSTLRKVIDVKIHEDFTLAEFSNDIALLKLDVPLTFNKFIQPVVLPDPKIDVANKLLTLSGWGIYDKSLEGSNFLRYASARAMDKKKCKRSLQKYNISSKRILCQTSIDFDDGPSCSGDSGGPVVLNGTSVLVGIVSFGIDCGFGENTSYSMRVSDFMDWIKKNMKD
ncbi:chymotrypsin-1-like [Culicoides brevitarsis]|uniref:chymotrypsin-1-like n=1 Tax=Culicoides brevitarsis TaxID=469753 RepID=UPI00307BB543